MLSILTMNPSPLPSPLDLIPLSVRRVRNFAPKIEMSPPVNGQGGYFFLSSELVGLDADLARQMVLPKSASDQASPAGAAATATNFPPSRRDIAPSIEIEDGVSVKIAMDKVPLPKQEASKIGSEYGVTMTIEKDPEDSFTPPAPVAKATDEGVKKSAKKAPKKSVTKKPAKE